MKISLNWLKKFIEIKETPEEIESILTETGLEVDELKKIEIDKNYLNDLKVGEILSIDSHPNADKLKITTVSLGEKNLSIICGASNIEIGQKVVVAKIGTKIKNIENKIIKINRVKIRGVASEGMICAEDEIGIGDSHSGILILPKNAKAGDNALNYFEILNDSIYDISITPNRADATSHLGVARDIKAVLKREIKYPDLIGFKSLNKKSINIIINNHEACPRYSGCIIENITIKDSPEKIKKLISSIGINPINNVVDITNYVMHSLGQPLHAFDMEKISKNQIYVRYANKGEKFTTLDGIERKLHENDLLICDAEKPMCIAGVFGGEYSGVSDNTKSIFLESAYFNPSDIRKSSLNHSLKTDASYRFERGIDPNITIIALKFACILINKYCGGEVVSDIYDIYPKKISNRKIEINYERINKLIGQSIKEKQINEILSLLDIKVRKEKTKIIAEVPPYRVDVTRESDIVEEILRIYGYNNINISEFNHSNFISDESKGSFENSLLNNIMSTLINSGYYEITTNSLTSSKNTYIDSWLQNETIEMINKLSDEHAVLKQHLLYTGLESLKYNINRKQNNIKFFEFDKEYRKNKKDLKEIKKLGIYLSGLSKEEHFNSKNKEASFFDIYNIINKILLSVNLGQYQIKESQSKMLSNAIQIKNDTFALCELGEVETTLLKKYDINQKVFYAELFWDNIISCLKNDFNFMKIPKFPEVKRDLSIILSKSQKFSSISSIIENNKRNIIKNYSLYNIYEGEQIGKNKVAYALRFMLQDENKTLEDKVINNTMENLIIKFEKELQAEIRK